MPPSSNDNSADTIPLFRRATHGVMWNGILLPLIGVANLVLAVIIRRSFGLFSGIYDVLLGLMDAVLQYSSLGIPDSLTKLVPEVGAIRGVAGLRRFVLRAAAVRVAVLALYLSFMNIFGGAIIAEFGLGVHGVTYLRLLTALVGMRAVVALCDKVLNAFFDQRTANGIALFQGLLDIGMVSTAVGLGHGMRGVITGLLASSILVALASVGYVAMRFRSMTDEQLRGLPAVDPGQTFEHSIGSVTRFSLFTYLFGLSMFFSGMGFAAPALAIVLAPEAVALFAIAFKLSFMTVGLAVSGFRGVYRPFFATLRIRNDVQQLQRAFRLICKAQIVVLFPAAVWLIVMSDDYVPLLFGQEFVPAVPIIWVLTGFMYAETAVSLSIIILSVDEQYRSVIWARAVTVLMAPVFLLTASSLGLVAAATVFGATRLASGLVGYWFCQRLYGVRYPWSFAGQIGAVSVAMGAALGILRMFWPTSVPEVISLAVVGVALFAVGVRMAKLLSAEDVDVVRRSNLPGYQWILRLLAPHLVSQHDETGA